MDWHARYLQQAEWTRSLRRYLLAKAGIDHAHRILEVGCGTGVILRDLVQACGGGRQPGAHILGLDISVSALELARTFAPGSVLSRGDAHWLPLGDACIDITCCHFLLMWLRDPLRGIREMRRVTRPGGHVLALAEPDYFGRDDRPEELAQIGSLQSSALAAQGADPGIGAHLAELFARAGLMIVETGTLAPQAPDSISEQQWASEWLTLRGDLGDRLPGLELDRLEQVDARARHLGQRRLFVPTYFVHAQV